MGRKPLSEEERKRRKKERDKAYYDKKIISKDGNKRTYSEYLDSAGVKQVKTTVTTDDYYYVKSYCGLNGITIQSYIRNLIREDIEKKLKEQG